MLCLRGCSASSVPANDVALSISPDATLWKSFSVDRGKFGSKLGGEVCRVYVCAVFGSQIHPDAITARWVFVISIMGRKHLTDCNADWEIKAEVNEEHALGLQQFINLPCVMHPLSACWQHIQTSCTPSERIWRESGGKKMDRCGNLCLAPLFNNKIFTQRQGFQRERTFFMLACLGLRLLSQQQTLQPFS